MIQRIQTLYLLLAAAASGGIFFLPFLAVPPLTCACLPTACITHKTILRLMSVTTIVLLDTVLTIFLFKNRKQQSLLTLFVAIQQYRIDSRNVRYFG